MKNSLAIVFILITSLVFSQQVDPGKYTIKNVKINTKYSDFGTTFYGKDKVVFASPKEGAVIAKTTWDGNNQQFLDLFSAEIDSKEGELKNKKRILGEVNNKFHEGVVAFTKDQKTVYFDANNYSKKGKVIKDSTGTVNIQLYRADVLKSGEWRNVVKLSFNSDQFSTGHPTLSVDDKKLYFISDRPGSIGKTDIFVVDILDDGTFGTLKNMGPKINTTEREMFPFISDENYLYFSSDGHQGYGELDVFASRIFDTTVSEAINLEEPVNSKKDDFAYIINDTNDKGYFSSNRPGGKGDDDIYTFVADPPLKIEGSQAIEGIVKDIDTDLIIAGATVELLDKDGKKLEKQITSETEGAFKFDANSDTDYTLEVKAPGYLKEQVDIRTDNETDGPPLEIGVKMDPELRVENEKIMININTIYFDFDKWYIRSDAAIELDKVIAVMKEHPSMIIESGSHTDSRAREAYNQILSEKRAKATVDYIVAGGIDRNRIRARGYGEMQLVNNCSSFVKCSRAEHQLNRRTEFVIVNDDDRFVQVNKQPENVVVDQNDISNIPETDKEQLEEVVSNEVKEVEEDQVDTDASFAKEYVKTKEDKTKYEQFDGQVIRKTKNKYIKIDPIYYDYDSWSLSSRELEEIADVAEIMQDNPEIKIEVQVHTDSKNTEKHNQLLSNKRAKSVVSYFISRGIKSDRIFGKGFGEEVLVNKCKSFVKCSKEEHQANRRMEFMIVEGNPYPITQIIEKEGDKFISTNPIYFNYDKTDIRKDAAYELERIVRILMDQPDMTIEAGSHTDSNNTEGYNQDLSNRRAKSVKDYLVSRGINASRIVSKGYGEMKLVNGCSSFVKCSPEEHQKNRRTEFRILKK